MAGDLCSFRRAGNAVGKWHVERKSVGLNVLHQVDREDLQVQPPEELEGHNSKQGDAKNQSVMRSSALPPTVLPSEAHEQEQERAVRPPIVLPPVGQD